MFNDMARMFAYGHQDARLWVVGLEEHCGDAADIAKRIAIRRAQPHEYFDLETFHLQLAQGMPTDVSVWDIASAIYQGVYERSTLPGRLDPGESDLLLAEILPFPRPQNHLWPAAYLAAFPDVDAYLAYALPIMSARLVEKVRDHRPEVVILHGKTSHNQWVDRHALLRDDWTPLRYGERKNETLKWRLRDDTLWLRTNNLVNNGHVAFQAPQIEAVVDLIRQHRVSRP